MLTVKFHDFPKLFQFPHLVEQNPEYLNTIVNNKGESDNEGPWLNWDWKLFFIIEMVKKNWATVTEFSQETENFHPCNKSHYMYNTSNGRPSNLLKNAF